MSESIKRIGIKKVGSQGFEYKDLGVEAANVEVFFNEGGDAIEDETSAKEVKSLNDVLNNLDDLVSDAAPIKHDSDDTTYGVGSKDKYGHVKAGTGIAAADGVLNLDFAASDEVTADKPIAANDSRLSDSRKNPNSVSFSDGKADPTIVSYDGSKAGITVSYKTIGAVGEDDERLSDKRSNPNKVTFTDGENSIEYDGSEAITIDAGTIGAVNGSKVEINKSSSEYWTYCSDDVGYRTWAELANDNNFTYVNFRRERLFNLQDEWLDNKLVSEVKEYLKGLDSDPAGRGVVNKYITKDSLIIIDAPSSIEGVFQTDGFLLLMAKDASFIDNKITIYILNM